MKNALSLFLILGTFSQLFGQTVFTSQPTGGNWNVGTTWDQTACASGCVAGVDYPGPNDVAIVAVTAGSAISFPRVGSPSYACKDLYVVNDVASSLRTTGISGSPTLTINGQISGALNDLSDLAEPTVNVFQATMSNINIIFTGSNLDDPTGGAVITTWGHLSPFYRITLNPGVGNTVRVDSHSIRTSSTVQSGTLQVNSGQSIRDFTGSSQFIVNASTTLNVLGAINGDGSTSSRFSIATINGTLTTSSTGYLNATTFTLGSAGAINVGFNGGNQTEGWWYQTASPSTLTLNATSTVSYISNTSQNVFATTYGHLSLSSSSTVTKTLSGSGLTLQGNLTIGSNVTFSPGSQVDFIGTATQTVSGVGTLNFVGGLEVNKSSGSVTLGKASSSTGLVITSGTLNLGDVTTTLNGATISNAGTITSGSAGSIAASGTTTFSGAGSTTLNNLTVSSGSTSFNNSVTVTGNLVNSGSLSLSSTSTITFSGGNNQSISGNAFTVGNMTVNKTSTTLSNNGTVELTGILTLTTGTFDADGSGSGIFTLNSDTNGDASIGTMAGGSITGEVTFERYFNNTSNRWRNLGFPVSSVTRTELGSSITLSPSSLNVYTESTLGNVDQGWTVVASGTLNSARGHSAWMFNIQPITISVRGPLLQNVPAQAGSPYNFGVTYTNDPGQPATEDGWNFIPNPFASPIDWDNSGWVKTNVNTAAAMWDIESNIYRYSNVNWDGVVAQGQAFWVQTNAASPVLTCTESVKVVNSDPTFYRKSQEEISSKLFVSLRSNLDKDVAMIQFREGSTSEFDGEFDAHKLKNGIFNLSTLTNTGDDLAANVLPKRACNAIIKLKITNIASGSYVLSFDGLQSFADVNSVKLVDHFADESTTLTEGGSYAFEVTADEASFGSERFELVFDFADLKAPQIEKHENQLISNYETGNQWYVNNEPIAGATDKYFTPSVRGSYYVMVNDGSCEMSSENILINEGLKRVFPNPATTQVNIDVSSMLNGNVETGEILLHSSQGLLVRSEKFTGRDFRKEIDLTGVQPGIYIITIISDKKKVLEKSKVVIK